MAGFSGQYEYLEPGRGAVRQGRCEVSFDAETLSLAGEGAPLAFDLGDVDVFERGEYELRLVLYTGHAVRLKLFGKAFQDLQHGLLAAYRDRLVRCLLVSDLDEVARFDGRVHLESPTRACEGGAEIRLYESNVAVLPDGAAGFQWRLAEIEAIEFDERDYAVVLARGAERLVIGRLAKRTGELAERLRRQASALDARAAKVLHALFPFLSPDQFRAVASVMREGAASPVAQLRGVHRLVEPTLHERVVDDGLRPYVTDLAGRAGEGWYAGFKIVRQGADASDTDADAEADPIGTDSGSGDVAESEIRPDRIDTGVGEGLEVLFWFFFPVGGRLAWEATSSGGRATYVFAPGGGPGGTGAAVAAVNSGLVALNFRREPVYLPADVLESDARYRHYAIAARKVPELALVRRAFVGRAIHRSVDAWRRQLDDLLSR